MYKREIKKSTVAIVSYTDVFGKRHSEERITLNGVECRTSKHLYNTILKCYTQSIKKPYVHEIISTKYWEE